MTTSSDDYKAFISGVFSRSSSAYDQIGPELFSLLGKRLVDYAALPEGARVLDVACGRGAVLFPASSAVSSSGEVIGIDISQGMVERTAADVLLRDITNTQVLRMDAEKLDFQDDEFDYVLCGLGLFFFPSLHKALAEFRRVLKPGGRLIASTFEDVEDGIEKRWETLNKSFSERLRPAPKSTGNTLDNEDAIRESLSGAGFEAIEVTREKGSFTFSNEDEWWQWLWSHGFRGFLERLDENVLAEYKEQVVKLVREDQTEQGIVETWHLLFAKAQIRL
jgi:ubiquinone/menaquinone biosynthesis C-methylase UbiE